MKPHRFAEIDLPDCLCCYNISANEPICTLYNGIIQFLADPCLGKNRYELKETKCKAMGGDSCYFIIVEKK